MKFKPLALMPTMLHSSIWSPERPVSARYHCVSLLILPPVSVRSLGTDVPLIKDRLIDFIRVRKRRQLLPFRLLINLNPAAAQI